MELAENVTRLVSDAERARDLKERIRVHLEAACLVMDEARAAGMIMNFQIGMQMTPNSMPKSIVQDISVIKPL